MKYRLLFSAILLLSAVTISFSNNLQDSLPILDPEYKGFRLAITDIKTEKIGEWIHFRFTVINTGVEDIKIDKHNSNAPIVLNIDELTSNQSLKKYASSFKQSFFNTELNINAGEIINNHLIKIENSSVETDLSHESENTAEITETQISDLSTTSALAKGMTETQIDDSQCSDLIIESVSIVKKSKSMVLLKYKIRNQGKQPALIVGTSKNQDDNLALKFHMSSSDKLTRGAIPIGGTIIKSGKQIPDGKLYPGKSLTEEVKIDIRNMTRFTPVIILEIDPYLSVQECNETNNLNHIKLEQ